jgi:hypothetical protein
MIKAKLRIASPNRQVSNSIIRCLEPDNEKMKGLEITSLVTPRNVSFSIAYAGRIETFISTLDDLLRCIQAANSTLGMIRKNRAG